MKIAVITNYFHPHVGGVENSVKNISKQIKKKHEISIFTKKYKHNLKDVEFVDGIKVVRIPSGIFKSQLWILKNRRLFLGSDIIQLHDFMTFFWIFPLFFYKSKSKKIIVFHGYESMPVKIKYKAIRWIITKFINNYICVGRYIEDYYPLKTKLYYYPGIKKVPNIIDIKDKKKSAIFSARIRSDTDLIGYLEALRILKNKYGKILELDVYGDGDKVEECKRFVKKNNLRVNFFGWDEDANNFFRDYKYSFSTQFGSSINAMANSSLIFSLARNKLKMSISEDILENGKHGIISKNSEDLAKRMNEYIENPKDAIKIIKSAHKFSKNYTWDNIVKKIYYKAYLK